MTMKEITGFLREKKEVMVIFSWNGFPVEKTGGNNLKLMKRFIIKLRIFKKYSLKHLTYLSKS